MHFINTSYFLPAKKSLKGKKIPEKKPSSKWQKTNGEKCETKVSKSAKYQQ
jgi:hypothetical protein